MGNEEKNNTKDKLVGDQTINNLLGSNGKAEPFGFLMWYKSRIVNKLGVYSLRKTGELSDLRRALGNHLTKNNCFKGQVSFEGNNLRFEFMRKDNKDIEDREALPNAFILSDFLTTHIGHFGRATTFIGSYKKSRVASMDGKVDEGSTGSSAETEQDETPEEKKIKKIRAAYNTVVRDIVQASRSINNTDLKKRATGALSNILDRASALMSRRDVKHSIKGYESAYMAKISLVWFLGLNDIYNIDQKKKRSGDPGILMKANDTFSMFIDDDYVNTLFKYGSKVRTKLDYNDSEKDIILSRLSTIVNPDGEEPTDYVKFKSDENVVVETSNSDDADDTSKNTDETAPDTNVTEGNLGDPSATEGEVGSSSATEEDKSDGTKTAATDNNPAGPYASDIIAKMFQNLNYEISKYEIEFRKLKN